MRWRDRFWDQITRRISSAEFRAAAAGNWLMRPFARAGASQLFDLCAGFVYSQTLLACVQLDLLALADSRPRTPSEVARHANLSPSAAEMLLRAAAALDLLRLRDDGTYGLGLQGAALIENPGVCAMIEHNALLYRDLADPVAFLRSSPAAGELGAFWGYGQSSTGRGTGAGDTDAYSRLMAISQAMVADEVLSAFSFADFHHLLDVGGGHGAFAAAVARRWPHMQLTIFDRPQVSAKGSASANVEGRAPFHFEGGDFLSDPLPHGADVISLIRVLHDHDDQAVARVLGATASALAEGGVLLVAEPMRGRYAQARVADAYFGFYLRGMGRGRVRSTQELEGHMRRAGFTDVRQLHTKVPLITSVLVGKTAKNRQKKLTV